MKPKHGSMIGALVIVVALVTACGPTDVPVTLVPVQPTATPIPSTNTGEPMSCEGVEGGLLRASL